MTQLVGNLNLPENIKNFIKDKPYTLDNIGMSGNTVLLFEDMVLKIENDVVSAEEQAKMMRWLEGK